MATDTKKYLDYEGLQKYHSKLIKKLVNLEYDPPRIFIDKNDLLTKSRWCDNPYGIVLGLKEGLLVTVNTELWQLENPNTFKSVFTTIGVDFSNKTPEELGWKVIKGSFEIDGNILKLN